MSGEDFGDVSADPMAAFRRTACLWQARAREIAVGVRLECGGGDCHRYCLMHAGCDIGWLHGGSAYRYLIWTWGSKGSYSSRLLVDCNIPKMIVMKRHSPITKTRIVLRTILSPGALVMLAFSGVDVRSGINISKEISNAGSI